MKRNAVKCSSVYASVVNNPLKNVAVNSHKIRALGIPRCEHERKFMRDRARKTQRRMHIAHIANLQTEVSIIAESFRVYRPRKKFCRFEIPDDEVYTFDCISIKEKSFSQRQTDRQTDVPNEIYPVLHAMWRNHVSRAICFSRGFYHDFPIVISRYCQ